MRGTGPEPVIDPIKTSRGRAQAVADAAAAPGLHGRSDPRRETKRGGGQVTQ